LLSKTSLSKIISMSEERRYSEAAESDDELPLTQGAAVQLTIRPAAAVLTSQAEHSKGSSDGAGQEAYTDSKSGGVRLWEEGWCTAAPQFPRVVCVLPRAIQQLRNADEQA
jgi:hypothetical protein